MKIRFKHQKFQEDAAIAVCDVFAGQPYLTPSYLIDRGIDPTQNLQQEQITYDDFTGWNNQPIIPALTDDRILENLQAVQQKHRIEKSTRLEGKYNLTVEMETGTRVIIVIGCINVLVSRVSGTLVRYNSCIA